MFLRKLLKWFLVLVAALALAVLVVIWLVLGVSPFEGKVDQLWRLTSNDVDFFVRMPGVQLLEEPVVTEIEQDPAFAPLSELKRQLADVNAQVARQVNPQIPLGVVEIDLTRDLAGSELAIAGTIQSDYSNPRLDNFLVMTRVAYYARYVSALKRSFVRSMLPPEPKIEVVKGLYLRIELDAEATRALNQLRTQKTRQHPDNVVFLARIGDVVLLSDNDIWIEDALAGGARVIPADPWFESDFIRTSRGGETIEAFVRTGLSLNLMLRHGQQGSGSPLSMLAGILPAQMTGDLTLRLTPKGNSGVTLSLDNHPPTDGFKKIKPHLQKIYDAEKADLRYDLSAEGIGRYIPLEGVVAAMVIHGPNEQLLELLMSYLSAADIKDLDDQVRKSSNFRSGYDLLSKLTADLADTHMILVHRPKYFEKADFSALRDPPEKWPSTSDGEFSFTVISRVKDSVRAAKVADMIKMNLASFGMKSGGPHKSGKFELAKLMVEAGDLELLEPAFGTIGEDGRYVFFSTSHEAAERVMAAAEFEGESYSSLDSMAYAARELPHEGTATVFVDTETLRQGLMDRVRVYARSRMDTQGMKFRFVQEAERMGRTVTDDEVAAEGQRYEAEEYPKLRDRYERSLSWLNALDVIAFGVEFGYGPEKRVRGKGIVTLLPRTAVE